MQRLRSSMAATGAVVRNGWNVVNVEYRLGRVALGPRRRGRLLLRAPIRRSAGKDLQRRHEPPGGDRGIGGRASGTHNIADVNDLLDGPNSKTYAVQWLGSLPNRDEIARRVSPLTYVRPGPPPILAIQGDADPTVPYEHSVRLTAALTKAGVPNQLVTIPGGKHGISGQKRARQVAPGGNYYAPGRIYC